MPTSARNHRHLPSLLPLLLALPLHAAEPPATMPFLQTFKDTTTTIQPKQKSQSTMEDYYDRDQGILRRDILPHGTYITRASFTDSIQYREGRSKFVHALGYDHLRESVPLNFKNLRLNPEDSPTRDADLDVTIDGQPLQAYLIGNDSAKYVAHMWIDAVGIERRLEVQFPSTPYSKSYTRRTDIELNPKLPANFWQNPPDMVEADMLADVGNAFPLKGALFSKTIDGHTFAVHALSRDADGDFFIITTCRQTPEAVKAMKFPLWTDSTLFYVDPAMPQRRLAWRDIEFASLHAGGISLGFHFIVPDSPDLASDQAKFSFAYFPQPAAPTTAPSPAAPIISDAKPTMIPFDLKVQNKQDTIAAFAGRAYDALDPFDGCARIELDLGHDHSPHPDLNQFAAWSRAEFIPQATRYLQFHQRLQRKPSPLP